MLYLDFETRSAVDIKKAGADVYARHPTTEILCVGSAVNDGPVECLSPGMLTLSRDLSSWTRAQVVAHNAPFELAIWNHVGVRKYGWPELRPEQVICTMAMSYAMALPGALADAAPAAGLKIQKDSVGHRVMLQLSQPRDRDEDCPFCEIGCEACVTWFTPQSHPEKFKKLYDYCRTDVEVERQLYKRLMRLSPAERELWQLDYKINQRGVRVDVGAVRKAMELVEGEKARLDGEIRALTEGSVSTCTATGQLTDWLRWQGVKTDGVAKADVSDLLARGDDLPPVVRRVLGLRQEAAKASTAKLKSMLAGVCEDGRLRGMFQFNGAGATRRWAGRRVQLQNLPRSRMSQVEIEGVFEVLGA